LHNTAKLNKVVIATGGGTPCFLDNMEWMNKEGITVYLEAPAGLLFHRLLTEKDKRPLLRGFNEIELMEYIHEHLAQREPYYNQALVKIKAASINVNTLKEKIRKAKEKIKKKKSA
jgi:shikimate kinase